MSDALDGFDAKRGVSGVGRNIGIERHRHVDELHGPQAGGDNNTLWRPDESEQSADGRTV